VVIELGNKVKIGGGKIVVMAGPCAVESSKQMDTVAHAVKTAGASVLRGGAFKARTSPGSFEGLGEKGLKMLAAAAKDYGLLSVTEVLDIRDIELISKYADIFQIGARNMQNVSLLKEIGKTDKPVLLKRGMGSTITELLLAAEYISNGGNHKIILCERGIRTFEPETRNTLSLSAVPLIKELSKFPVIVDPSHGTGRAMLVAPMSKASIAAGADGLLIDVHPNPEKALCDGRQAIKINIFGQLMKDLKPLAKAIGRNL
jgi:3-deoxy-7-phosphoheptulonate synthase